MFILVCSEGNQTIIDLNIQFFSDYALSVPSVHFVSKQTIYVLMSLYKRNLNTTLKDCLLDKHCTKSLRMTGESLNFYGGQCPLSDLNNIYLIISKVYFLSKDKTNKYTLYRETPRYYGIEEDSSISHYRYYNRSYCHSQVVFSFVLKHYYSKTTGELPNLIVDYTYLFTNQSFNISNYRHLGHLHERKKTNEYLVTCCSYYVCGYERSCLNYYLNGLGGFTLVFLLVLVVVGLGRCCLFCKLRFSKPKPKPVEIQDEERIQLLKDGEKEYDFIMQEDHHLEDDFFSESNKTKSLDDFFNGKK